MTASSVKKDEYDFDNMDDVARFVKEVIVDHYELELEDEVTPEFFACGMPILTGLSRLMETRPDEMKPIAVMSSSIGDDGLPKPGYVVTHGEGMQLHWNGAEDYSWVML